MPILRKPRPEEDLSQGDVLADIYTFVTEVDRSPGELGPGHVIVVSRNCNAVRDPEVIVAPVVKKVLANLNELNTFDAFVTYFSNQRDGVRAPDAFYLGEFDGEPSSRYFATFDRLYTISIPEVGPRRRAFLESHRRYSLDVAFIHDMHQRLFRAFASLGFDDQGWWSPADFEILMNKADAELAALTAEVNKANSELDVAKLGDPKQVIGKEKALENRRETLEKFKEKIGPFTAERLRRQAK